MNYFRLLKSAFSEWGNDKASVWAASLSYFTVFSLSPLLLLLTAIVGIFFGEKAIHGQLFGQMQSILGPDAAALIEKGISNTTKPTGNIIVTIIGIVTLLLGATGIFDQMQQAFNAIWKVKTKPKAGITVLLRDKLLSFSMLLIIGFLLAISVGLSFLTNILATSFSALIPIPIPVMGGIDLVVSFIVLALLFAAMFKILPDIAIPFKTVIPGAILTALLFVLGKFALGWYIGRSAYTSTYGAAGSLLVILVWVYYSIQLLLLGAEFTKVYAKAAGVEIVPSHNAVSTEVLSKNIKHKEPSTKEKAVAVGGFLILGTLSRVVANLITKAMQRKL